MGKGGNDQLLTWGNETVTPPRPAMAAPSPLTPLSGRGQCVPNGGRSEPGYGQGSRGEWLHVTADNLHVLLRG